MSLKTKITRNKKIKRFVYWAMIPSHEARPRKWVSWLVNPFVHRRGKGTIVKSKARLDVLPSNKFDVGSYSMIEDFSTINNGVGDVIIGDNSFIGIGNVIIGPVIIGNSVMFAQNVIISGLNHGYKDVNTPIRDQPVTTMPIIIEDEVWLGANVVITAGVTVGKHCVVAAGSVVTKSIAPYSIVVGNPARVIKIYDFKTGEWIRV